MTSVEEIGRDFESSGEDTLRDFVEILLTRNAELVAALRLIARQTEPRPDMPDVAVGICSAVNRIALEAAP